MKLQPVLEDLQFIQANYYPATIQNAIAALPDEQDIGGSIFKRQRKYIVHLILRRRFTLGEVCTKLGLPQKNKSAVAMQVHQFCRERHPRLYDKGIVWHDTPYGKAMWHTPVRVEYLQVHADKFLK
jgi:hypothetical protein